jgi:hypothetical protein
MHKYVLNVEKHHQIYVDDKQVSARTATRGRTMLSLAEHMTSTALTNADITQIAAKSTKVTDVTEGRLLLEGMLSAARASREPAVTRVQIHTRLNS